MAGSGAAGSSGCQAACKVEFKDGGRGEEPSARLLSASLKAGSPGLWPADRTPRRAGDPRVRGPRLELRSGRGHSGTSQEAGGGCVRSLSCAHRDARLGQVTAAVWPCRVPAGLAPRRVSRAVRRPPLGGHRASSAPGRGTDAGRRHRAAGTPQGRGLGSGTLRCRSVLPGSNVT
jgi:hypothetical protein